MFILTLSQGRIIFTEMTNKKGQNWRIEADIDKNREENNWKRVIELADQLKTSNGILPKQHIISISLVKANMFFFWIFKNIWIFQKHVFFSCFLSIG